MCGRPLLRHDRIDAPWVLDGPINGERFRVYVEKVLAPTLKPGDIVVMDNLGSHKSEVAARTVDALCEAIGHLLDAFPMPGENAAHFVLVRGGGLGPAHT